MKRGWGVTYVALVVVGVEVYSIPARGEGDLRSDGVAVVDGKTVGLLVDGSDTVMADGTLCDVVLVECSEILVTGDHSQTGGRRGRKVGLDTRAASAASLVVAGTVLVVDGLWELLENCNIYEWGVVE